MQVNNTEINGFLIDQFNQHNLDVGKAQGICPLCSSDRQPKNQKAKCASYDWERGLGTCHHCDSSFQLHTYQRKGSSEKTYLGNVKLVWTNGEVKKFDNPQQQAAPAPAAVVEDDLPF